VITVSRKGNLLLAQPKGQKVYPMEPIEKDMFKHDRSGVILEFTPEKSIMLMKQGATLNVFKTIIISGSP
jgi:hypothetical protein